MAYLLCVSTRIETLKNNSIDMFVFEVLES